MIGKAPEFTKSEYFVSTPKWHLEADAPEALKKEFEKFMNSPCAQRAFRRDFPKMGNPWYTWEGKVIDKPREDGVRNDAEDEENGRWVTTENNHKVFIDENGEPTKGNPHVIETMTGGKRDKNDFLPKNSYLDNPEVKELTEKHIEAWKRHDEYWEKCKEIEKEMESEFTPKKLEDLTDDDFGRFGHLGTRYGVFTEKGKELEKEKNKIFDEVIKAERERSRASDELKIVKWKARADELKKYQQPELKKAEADDYEGFTTETTGTSWGDGVLKSGNAFIAEMSPKEYLERCAFEIFYGGTLESTMAPVHIDDVNKYAEMMKNGTKFDMPYLDYEDRGQEGRHRAVAAYLLGIEKLPVLVVGDPPTQSELEGRVAEARKEARKLQRELKKKESERMDAEDDGRWITTKNHHKVHLNENGEPDMGNPNVIEKMMGGNSEKLAYARKKYRNITPKLKSKRDELDAYNRDIKRKEELTEKAKSDLETAKTAVKEAKERQEKLGGKSADELEEASRDAYYGIERCKRALKYLEEERNSGNESEVFERLQRFGFGNFQSLDEAVSMIEEHQSKKKAEYDDLMELSAIANRYGRDGGVRKAETAVSDCEMNLEKCEKNEEDTKNRRDAVEKEYNTIREEAEEARKYYQGIAKKELTGIEWCGTSEDVEMVLEAGGYFQDGTSAKFGDLDVESAKYIAGAIDRLTERYPYLKGKLVPIEAENMAGSNLGGYIPEQKRIAINEKIFADIDRLEERYQKSTEEGIHPYGTSADAIIFHEYAHQIDDILSEGMPDGERFSSYVLKKVTEATGSAGMIKDMVSQYAMREYPYNKDGDFFAEALAEYLSSSRPRDIARRVGTIFERRLSILARENRMDADEDENQNGGNHGNTRIPFGLCEREGIEIGKDWTPSDAWDALKGKGYNPGEVYENLRKTGKATGGKAKSPVEEAKNSEKIKEDVRNSDNAVEFWMRLSKEELEKYGKHYKEIFEALKPEVGEKPEWVEPKGNKADMPTKIEKPDKPIKVRIKPSSSTKTADANEKGVVTLNPEQKDTWSDYVFYHEMGHQISELGLLEDVVNNPGGLWGRYNQKHMFFETQFGVPEKNPDECFADMYAYYRTVPDKLREKAPDVYDYFERLNHDNPWLGKWVDDSMEEYKRVISEPKKPKLTDKEYKAAWKTYNDRVNDYIDKHYSERTAIEKELRESGEELVKLFPEVEKAKKAVENAKKDQKFITGRSEEELQRLIDKENEDLLKCEKLRKDISKNPPRSIEEFEDMKRRAKEVGVDIEGTFLKNLKYHQWGELGWYVTEMASQHETARFWLLKEAKILRESGPDGGVAEAEKNLADLTSDIEQKKARRERIKRKQQNFYEKLEEGMKEFDSEREKCMEAARERFPTVDDCKTREDLAEKMFGDGLFSKVCELSYFANISFESAKEITSTIYEFMDKNPEIKGKIGQIKVDQMSGGRYAQTKEFGPVSINKLYYGATSTMKAKYNQDLWKGFHPEGTDHRLIVLHEYTHQLDFYMTRKLGLPDGEMFSDRVLKEVSEKLSLDADECKRKVSSYAMKEYPDGRNSCEFLAEAYGEFMNSKAPRDVAVAVGETIQKYLKQLRHDSRMDADEDENQNGGGNHGNTRIPFGLCEREGIEIGKDWTPSDAWEALKGKGYNPDEVYENLKKTGKADNPAKKTNWREEAQKKIGAAWSKLTDAESKRDKSKEETAFYSMRVEVTENEAKNAKKAVELAEEINGRSAEQLEADADELDNQIQEWNAAIKKSKRRPKAGTPEKEEWDEWYRSVGGKSGIEWMKQQAEWKEQDYERLNELWQMMTENPNVGDLEAKKAEYEKAVKKQERTRSKYEESAARTKALEAEVEEAKRERDEARAERFHTAREQIKSYDECESAEDVSDRLNGGDYFKTGSRADFAEVDLEYAKGVAETTESFFEQHPMLKGKLGSVRSDSYMIYHEGGRAYAGSEYDGDVLLNPNKFGDPQKLEEDLKHDLEKGFHPPETTYKSLIMHEYTHQMDNFLSTVMSKIAPNTGCSTFNILVIDEVRHNLGLSYGEVQDAVSGYAKMSDSEWLAEAYSETLTAKNPRPVAVEVGKVVRKYLTLYEESLKNP